MAKRGTKRFVTVRLATKHRYQYWVVQMLLVMQIPPMVIFLVVRNSITTSRGELSGTFYGMSDDSSRILNAFLDSDTEILLSGGIYCVNTILYVV